MRVAWLVQAGVLLLAWPVAAQIKVGEVSSRLSGTITSGYDADYGNMDGSDHNWTVGGIANYSGSFYSPNFLSFNASVYLNQSRANSNFQSISNASGIDTTANIFGGSRFPGSITYTKAYNSDGNYAVPGLANYVTHGNNDTLGISWSENLPDAPSLSAGFQTGSSQYSVYGTNDQGNNSFHSFNLHSGYRFAGFNMGAYYSTGGSHSLIPLVVTGEQATEANSDTSAYGFNVSHRLPMQGSISTAINRSSWNSEFQGSTSTGTIDTINSLASVRPTSKVSFTAIANYSDNLSGQLIESIVAAGGVVPGLNSSETSDSLDLMGVASYVPATNLQTSAYVERRTQSFLGENYGVETYGASASYARPVLDGNFNASLNVTENTSDQTGEDTLGFSNTENYSSEIMGWKVGGTFGYAQNVQTLLVTYMNSFYHYSGTARRRWGKLNLSMGAGASRTALTEQAGTANSSQSYNASLGYGVWLMANGSYSKSSGQALATGSGLVPVPIPSPILSSSQVSFYGGDSYSFGLSSTPVKGLVLTADYAKSISNISSNASTSLNDNNEFNALIQYQARKLSFNSGYARLEQGFSASGTQPEVISSFYIGVSRWFNFF
ncbi:MAG: hypothetical protein ACLPY1_11505 [Terracidiphilus sp.]